VISPKTVGNHIEHIYAKIDPSTRAAASLFAMQHGLLPRRRVRSGLSGLQRKGGQTPHDGRPAGT
jgi:hypothetical protein